MPKRNHYFSIVAITIFFEILSPVLALPPQATTLPQGFTEIRLASGINPTSMVIAQDGRIFYCEKDGRVRVVKKDALLPKPFVTVNVDITSERGLLGITLAPGFPSVPYVYTYYTVKSPLHNRLSRFKADGDTALTKEEILLELTPLSSIVYHNGGGLHFGKDGKLYIVTGDLGDFTYSQSLDVPMGKVLRINADGSIPSDNPYYSQAQGINRAIWGMGLRNPFTTAYDPGTDRFFINDVGQNTVEEINSGRVGANFGWPETEGPVAVAPTDQIGSYANPVYSYLHAGPCSAITGGAFYNPVVNSFGPEYQGGYFFGDYCNGWIKFLKFAADTTETDFATGILRPLDMKVAPDGSLYYFARGETPPGVVRSTEEDNMRTLDGSLNKITGPNTMALARGNGMSAMALNSYGANLVVLPLNKDGLRLFDSNGRRIWEFHRGNRAGDVSVQLPNLEKPGIFYVTLME